MRLTQLEKDLITAMEMNSVPKGTTAGIFLMLKREDYQIKMLQYILDNKKASPDELMAMARKISGK